MHRAALKTAVRLVVKLGTGVLTDSRKQPDPAQLELIVAQLAALRKSGKEVVLVTSGAVGAGMGALGWEKRPTDLAELQACAAVGQPRLMTIYEKLFAAHDLHVAQVLLTHDDLEHHERHLNARNTLVTLLGRGVVPVINENDAVSFTEIKFGDNDTLSALVASLLPADLLVILTTVDGVIENFGEANPKTISVIEKIDSALEKLAHGTDSDTAVGGMKSKVEAAKIAVRSGIPLVIASGKKKTVRSALVHLDRAIARDSTFAAAFASKAQAWGGLADGYVSPQEGYGHARDAAARSLALDSSQARAYAALGFAVLALDLDAHEAERLGQRAVALDPGGDQPHALLSYALFAEGRIDESLEEARRAWQADSLASMNGVSYAWWLILGHRFDAAAALLPRLRAILPPADADGIEGIVLAARGDFRGATHLLNWRYYGGLVAGTYLRALLARGDTVAARATVDSMLVARALGYYNPIALAKAYAAFGDLDKGIEWLTRAFDEHTLWLILVRIDDELAPLRADPRYAALDRQLRY